jgi:hypothetical protein
MNCVEMREREGKRSVDREKEEKRIQEDEDKDEEIMG